jgi:hypothetical protein
MNSVDLIFGVSSHCCTDATCFDLIGHHPVEIELHVNVKCSLNAKNIVILQPLTKMSPKNFPGRLKHGRRMRLYFMEKECASCEVRMHFCEGKAELFPLGENVFMPALIKKLSL